MSFPSGTVKLAHGVGAMLITVSVIVAGVVILLLMFGNTGPEDIKWANFFTVLGYCFKGFMLGLATSVLAVIAQALEKIAGSLP